jgi:hypothetical protein
LAIVSFSFAMSGAVGAPVADASAGIGSGGLGGSCGDANGTINDPDIANQSTNARAAAAISLNKPSIVLRCLGDA